MALNLSDRITVLKTSQMQFRVSAALANYALYILGEPSNTANHVNRLAWAKGVIQDPESGGHLLSWYVLNQPDFINGGSDITDASLTGIVETAINNYFIPTA